MCFVSDQDSNIPPVPPFGTLQIWLSFFRTVYRQAMFELISDNRAIFVDVEVRT